MRLVDECHFCLKVSIQFIRASAFPIDNNEEKMATMGNAISTRLGDWELFLDAFDEGGEIH